MLDQITLEYVYLRIKNQLDALAGSKILLTGGTGFFGKWFLSVFDYYNNNNVEKINIFIPTRNPDIFLQQYSFFNRPFFHFIKGDLIDFKLSINVDYIIHAAAEVQTSPTLLDSNKYLSDSTKITSNILSYAKDCKSIVFTSSGAVYGDKYSTDIYPKEFDSLTPSTPYGQAKVNAEIDLINFADSNNLQYSIARCFSFIGPYLPLNANFALGNFINNGLSNKDIIVSGNGKPIRSFYFMGDLVVSIIKLLTLKYPSKIYNIGSDNKLDIQTLASHISSYFPKISYKVLQKYDGQPIPMYVPNIELALKDNVIEDPLDFESSLALTLAWFQKNHS